MIKSQGMTVTWNANGSTGNVELWVAWFLDPNTAAQTICTAPAQDGTFTIPTHALLPLPSSTGHNFALRSGYQTPASSAAFPVPGLDIGIVQTFNDGGNGSNGLILSMRNN